MPVTIIDDLLLAIQLAGLDHSLSSFRPNPEPHRSAEVRLVDLRRVDHSIFLIKLDARCPWKIGHAL